jgi:hypothetical protein
VLFGGGDTWTWNGTAWTKHKPAHSPGCCPAMAYDAATGTVVLFGGGDTWSWDGTDWTQLHPAHAPSPRAGMGMAYDAAHCEVVLFGGENGASPSLDDTWTWDGTDWTQQHPAHAPSPRAAMGVAYDAARGQVVLFGGFDYGPSIFFDDTWTWNGTDWRKQHPAHAPPPVAYPALADDVTHAQVLLFGGENTHKGPLGGDTWTWDGTDWTLRAPPASPPPRFGAGLAGGEPPGGMTLFGGHALGERALGDTWTWDGTTWTLRLTGAIQLHPRSGAPGAFVRVEGWGFAPGEDVHLVFVDSDTGETALRKGKADDTGAIRVRVQIPSTATAGNQHVTAQGLESGAQARVVFIVT